MWLLWRVEGGIDVASLECGGCGRCGFFGEWKEWMWLLWRGEGGIDVFSGEGRAGLMWLFWRVEVGVDSASLESGGQDRCGFSGEWRAG